MSIDGKKFMDSFCAVIFIVLGAWGELRSDELYDIVKLTIPTISSRTFSLHLKHLIAKKIIDRDPKSHKYVVYRIKPKKMDMFKDFTGFAGYAFRDNNREKIEREKQLFLSLPIKKQIHEALQMATERTLLEFRLGILYKIYKHEDDALKLIILGSDYFKRKEDWLIESCNISDKIKESVLDEIYDIEDKFSYPREIKSSVMDFAVSLPVEKTDKKDLPDL